MTPETLTRRQLREHYGLGPVEADAVFRALPVISLPGCRTVRVRRGDVEAHLEKYLTMPGEVRR